MLTTLMLLTASMLLGAATANMTLMNEKAARNGRDRTIAFQAAEAALSDALLDLQHWRGKADAFPRQVGRCGTPGAQAGLCRSDGAPLWKTVDLGATSIAYGSVSGRVFAHGGAMLAAQAPRYLIELLQLKTSPVTPVLLRYRISAIGFGPQQHNHVLLQTIYSISAGEDAQSGTATLPPARRLSWREIDDINLEE